MAHARRDGAAQDLVRAGLVLKGADATSLPARFERLRQRFADMLARGAAAQQQGAGKDYRYFTHG